MTWATALVWAASASVNGADTTRPPSAELPSWPPTLKQLQLSNANDGAAAHLSFKGGREPSVVATCKSAVHNHEHHVVLLSICYFRGAQFVGIHQRLEERPPGQNGIESRLPDTPTGADKAVVTVKTYAIQMPGNSPRWYSNTWDHFTTAQIINESWTFQIWTRPVDMDLEKWLIETQSKYRAGVRKTQAFAIEP